MRWSFGGIYLVEQTEQKVRRFESVLKKRVSVKRVTIIVAFYFMKHRLKMQHTKYSFLKIVIFVN